MGKLAKALILALSSALQGQHVVSGVNSAMTVSGCVWGSMGTAPTNERWDLFTIPGHQFLRWRADTNQPIVNPMDLWHGVLIFGVGESNWLDMAGCPCMIFPDRDIIMMIGNSTPTTVSVEIEIPTIWAPSLGVVQAYYFRAMGASTQTPYGSCQPFGGVVGPLWRVSVF